MRFDYEKQDLLYYHRLFAADYDKNQFWESVKSLRDILQQKQFLGKCEGLFMRFYGSENCVSFISLMSVCRRTFPTAFSP